MKITFAELKLRARRSLYGNLGTLAGIQILMGILSFAALPVMYLLLIPAILGLALFGGNFPMAAAVLIVGMLLVVYFVFFVAASLLRAGFSRIMLDIARAAPVEFERLLFPFKNQFPRFAGMTAVLLGLGGITAIPVLVYDLAVYRPYMDHSVKIILFLFQGGMVLWLTSSFSQMYLLLLENPEKTVFQCLGESYGMMKGNRLRFLLLQISFLGWYLLGFLSFGIGFLWIIPYVSSTGVHFHLDLMERRRLGMNDERGILREPEREEMKSEAWDKI